MVYHRLLVYIYIWKKGFKDFILICSFCAGISVWGGGDQYYHCQYVHAGGCICRPVSVWHDPHAEPCQSFTATKYLLQDTQLRVYSSHPVVLSYPARTVMSFIFLCFNLFSVHIIWM